LNERAESEIAVFSLRDAEVCMLSGASNAKVSKEKWRKNLVVLAKTLRLKRLFFSKAFKQQL